LIAAQTAAASAKMPTHPLPCNASTRQKLLGFAPFTLPSAVHLPFRFRPHFQQRGLSLRALTALSPLHRFGSIKHQTGKNVKRFPQNFFKTF
jgi:hypothetical protein